MYSLVRVIYVTLTLHLYTNVYALPISNRSRITSDYFRLVTSSLAL